MKEKKKRKILAALIPVAVLFWLLSFCTGRIKK